MMRDADLSRFIFILFVAFICYQHGIHNPNNENSPTRSTIAPNTPDESLNDDDEVDSSIVIQNQIELELHTAISSILDRYFINLETNSIAETDVSKFENDKNDLKIQLADLLDNKLSASLLLENNKLNNELLQLNQDKEQTLAEYLEINKKYIQSVETLSTCNNRVVSLIDHQVHFEKNLIILELKIKDIIHENLKIKDIIHENNRMIQDLIVLEQKQAEKLKEIENKYQLKLINKQQVIEMLKKIILEDLDESAQILKTLTAIMKFNEDNVPDDLLEKRRQLFEQYYNENQVVVIDHLRKVSDEIALTSNSQFSNRYFCNKKISYYDSTICAFLSENLKSYEIDLSDRNLAVLPKDIFTGFENVEKIKLSMNRLSHLEPGTFNNLSNLQRLHLDVNNLTTLPSDVFNGLEKLTCLSLSRSNLSSLPPGTFNHLPNLKYLRIQGNHLISLPKNLFAGLENLEVLDLSYNRLSHLESDFFNNLPALKGLDIEGNNLPQDLVKTLEKVYNLPNDYQLWSSD